MACYTKCGAKRVPRPSLKDTFMAANQDMTVAQGGGVFIAFPIVV